MPVDTSVIGKPTSASVIAVERGPVANFARAVKDDSATYQDTAAAEAAGLPGIPAPPTFTFAGSYWGAYPDLQKGVTKPEGNPMFEIIGKLMANGGLVLHGEQEFVYHRPVVVGDVLVGKGTCVDAYERESKGKVMTFVVSETVWSDQTSGEPVVTERFNLIHRR
jgi:acyl dehydratase